MIEMRSEQQMFDLILGKARADERVRAVYMNGSRANPEAEADKYRDYDIVYVVTDVPAFVNDKALPSGFGEVAMVQEPDVNDIYNDGVQPDSSRHAWLMLFKDGNRIDLTVIALHNAAKEYTSDKLTVPLLDKDGILPPAKPSTDEDYHIKKPSERQYFACCNEFWWCLNNVAKGTVRGELPYAQGMLNIYVREMLDRMADWYIGINTGFGVSSGKLGKYYGKYLPAELYGLYKGTYAAGDCRCVWQAVSCACELFRVIASQVAAALGFTYNESDDANMTAYLKAMENEEPLYKA